MDVEADIRAMLRGGRSALWSNATKWKAGALLSKAKGAMKSREFRKWCRRLPLIHEEDVGEWLAIAELPAPGRKGSYSVREFNGFNLSNINQFPFPLRGVENCDDLRHRLAATFTTPPYGRAKALRTLGGTGNESADEITKLVRSARSRTHPDKGGDPDEFRKVIEAAKELTQ